MAGPGKVQVLDRHSEAIQALLYNFEIGKDQLKPEHEEWLKYNVVGHLQRGGSLVAFGLSSRSDTDARNMKLSQKRLHSALTFLRKASPNNFKIRFSDALGERVAKATGSRDGSEEEHWRAVLISAWSRPEPPPVPPPPPPKPVAPPLMVERRVYAKFVSSFSVSSLADDDFPETAALANIGTKAMFNRYGGQLNDEKKMMKQATDVARVIFVEARSSGTQFSSLAGASVIECHVFYEWGPRRRPFCILVDNFMRVDPNWKGEPSVAVIDDSAYCNLWIENPFKASQEFKDRRPELRFITYQNYLTGNY